MNLRHLIIVFVAYFFVIFQPIYAQSTYTQDSVSNVKGMGGPILSLGAIHGNFASFLGGTGGLMIKDFTLGAFGLWQTTHVTDWEAPENYISMFCGGIWIGYAFWTKKNIHPVVDLLGGVGNYNSFLKNSYAVNYSGRSQIFCIIPRLGAEFNVGKYVRISIGAEYRYIDFIKSNQTKTAKDVSSPGAYITLKLGEF